MSLIADPQAFVDKVLHRQDEHCCPPLWLDFNKEKRHPAAYYAACLRSIRSVSVQQHWCFTCRHSDSEELPHIAPHHWYTGQVQRTSLDM